MWDSLKIKEVKIKDLEKRLQESEAKNKVLFDELELLKEENKIKKETITRLREQIDKNTSSTVSTQQIDDPREQIDTDSSSAVSTHQPDERTEGNFYILFFIAIVYLFLLFIFFRKWRRNDKSLQTI